jgi:parvulin-like peptidyl-prolyl isomerase
MGHFHQGQIIEELEEVVLKMKVGEISDPIKTIYGYSILKLVEDNPPRQLSYDEMKAKLTESERKKQAESHRKAWLEGLKAKYKVVRTGS